jgi:hypothetical protein
MPSLPSMRSLREQTNEQSPLHIMTLTCGGLGNILFQWFATEAHARSHIERKPVTSYRSGYMDKRPDITAYEMFSKVATFESLDIPRNIDTYKEQLPHIYNKIRTPSSSTQLLDGYFQSYKYFEPYRRELVAELRKNGGNALARAEEWLTKMRRLHNKRLVGIHVRLGDYLFPGHLDAFYLCNPAYWERALRTALAASVIKGPENDVIVISTENPELVKEMHAFKGLKAAGYEILWLSPEDDVATTEHTFWTLAGMDALLISNSSFSLAAWYCRDREAPLISPTRWCGKHRPPFNIHDIVPQETILVE